MPQNLFPSPLLIPHVFLWRTLFIPIVLSSVHILVTYKCVQLRHPCWITDISKCLTCMFPWIPSNERPFVLVIPLPLKTIHPGSQVLSNKHSNHPFFFFYPLPPPPRRSSHWVLSSPCKYFVASLQGTHLSLTLTALSYLIFHSTLIPVFTLSLEEFLPKYKPSLSAPYSSQLYPTGDQTPR